MKGEGHTFPRPDLGQNNRLVYEPKRPGDPPPSMG